MSGLVAALRKEALEQVRSYRFLVIAAVLVAFGLLSPLLAKVTPELFSLIPGGEQFVDLIPEPTVLDAFTQYIKNISQFALLLAILVTMGAVAQEKEKGTAAMILVKPLPRWGFLLAKFLIISLVFAVSLVLAGLGAYYYTGLLFEPTSLATWMALNSLLFVYTLVYVALTLLFSTLSRSQVLAGGLSIATLILLGLLGSLPTLGKYMPGKLVSWGSTLYLQPELTAWPALWVSLGLILASLLVAWLVFRRQEL
jgi:ABC-2 type transport system permease protein